MSSSAIYLTTDDVEADDLIYLEESDVVDDSCPEEDDYQWCPRIVRQDDGDDPCDDNDDVTLHKNDVINDANRSSSSSSPSDEEQIVPTIKRKITKRKTLAAVKVLGTDLGLEEGCYTTVTDMSSVAGRDNMQDDTSSSDMSSIISSIQDYGSPIRPYSPSYTCSECGKSFISKFWLFRHQESCGIGLQNTNVDSSVEKRPFRLLLTPDTTVLQCAVCPQMFLTQKVLDFHSMKHEKYERGSRAAKRFRCPECEFPMYYTSAEGLRGHREQKHQPMFVPQRPTAIVTMRMQVEESDITVPQEEENDVSIHDSTGNNVTYRSADNSDSEGREDDTSVNLKLNPSFRNKPKVRSTKEVTGSKMNRYFCTVCKKSFTSRANQLLHVAKIHQKWKIVKNKHVECISKPTGKNAKCDICGTKFGNSFSLRIHKQIHEKVDRKTGKVKKYRCNICQSFFSTDGSLWNHKDKYHSGPKGEKEDVNKTKKSKDEPLKKEAKLDKKGRIQCNVCYLTFTHKVNFITHQRVHVRIDPTTGEEKKYKCKICKDTYFSSSRGRSYHMSTFHSTFKNSTPDAILTKVKSKKQNERVELLSTLSMRKDNYSCFICGRNFSYAHRLDVHKRVHERIDSHTGDVKKCKCKICNETYFQTIYGLTQHKATYHKKAELQSWAKDNVQDTGRSTITLNAGSSLKIKCPECPVRLIDRGALTRHRRIHQAIDPKSGNRKPFTCRHCRNSYFEKKCGLVVHETRCQRRQQGIGANLRTKTLSQAKKNRVMTQVPEKTLSCTDCSLMFRFRTHLLQHSKIHQEFDRKTGQTKQYKCDICQKCFFTSQNILGKHKVKCKAAIKTSN